MPFNTDSVFAYSFLLCVVLSICAFAFFDILRKKWPSLQGHRLGKVRTESLDHLDLIGLGLFFTIYAFFLKQHLDPPKLDEHGNPAKVNITPTILFVGYIVQCVPPLIVIVLLVFREINPVNFFGLLWKNARYLVVIAPAGVIFTYIFIFGLEINGFNTWLKELFGNGAKLQETVKIYQETDAVTIRVMLAISVILIAPVMEEIVFRGYLYTATKRFSNGFVAALLSSLLFAVVHFNIAALLPLFFLALILTLAYELTGSIWAPISIHTLFNATTILAQEIHRHNPPTP